MSVFIRLKYDKYSELYLHNNVWVTATKIKVLTRCCSQIGTRRFEST